MKKPEHNAMNRYYFSLQYSAIQKIVLRHNRLWSIAGISQDLARLNEIDFLDIANRHGGKALVAGGGKLTCRFDSDRQARSARSEIIKTLAIRFPMLEFQASDIVAAPTFAGAKEEHGIIEQLAEKKMCFRGHGYSYLPHLAVCEECGEYPAESRFKLPDGARICRTCHQAKSNAKIHHDYPETIGSLTTLERIYSEYMKKVKDAAGLNPVKNFDDLFQGNGQRDTGEKKLRLAVWFSDLNNMNQKVPVWLARPEDEILPIFTKVKDANIDIVADALAMTFCSPKKMLPFRLVVAGGDDLCIVMPENYILDFTFHLHCKVNQKISCLDNKEENNPLSRKWLEQHARDGERAADGDIGPYSFGGSFVVASRHTPFRRIHEIGEALMKTAKEDSQRQADSVNWRVMAGEEAVSDLLDFERPLAIGKDQRETLAPDNPVGQHLSFEEYLDLRRKFSTGKNNISSSHRFAIISRLIELKAREAEDEFEDWLKHYDSGEAVKSFSGLLTEPRLRAGESAEGRLLPARVATLFELLGIQHGNNHQRGN
jgi:hypothetical protein